MRGDAASTFVLVVSPRVPAEVRARIGAAPARQVLCQQFLPRRAEPAVTLLSSAFFGPLVGGVPPGGPPVAKLSPPFLRRRCDGTATSMRWPTGAVVTGGSGWAPRRLPNLVLVHEPAMIRFLPPTEELPR